MYSFEITVGVLCEKTDSVLFGKIAAKRTKNGMYEVSPVATGDQGLRALGWAVAF